MTRKAIQHEISRNETKGLYFVEAWFSAPKGKTGTGYLRTFDDWVRAACYIDELRCGRVSGNF